MLRKILLSSILLVLLPFTIWCSERAGRPVQLQLVNFSGVASGYHISDSIYLGYTYVSSMDLSLEPQNPSTLYGQDYVEKMDVEENQDQSIELRISPFDSGLYFSIGGLSTGRKYQKVTFENASAILQCLLHFRSSHIRVSNRQNDLLIITFRVKIYFNYFCLRNTIKLLSR